MAAPDAPLIAALALDAQDAFLHTVEHIPPEARSSAPEHLNAPGWIVAHAIDAHDTWFTRFARGHPPEELDPFCCDWWQRQNEAGREHPIAVDLDEALAAAARVFERTTAYLETCDGETLGRAADVSGTRRANLPVTAAYYVARSVAHLYAHAGELSVLASLAGAGDARLPGRLERTSTTEGDRVYDHGSPPLTARLFLDARDELVRVAEALPAAAHERVSDRLNSGAFIVAHVAHVNDVFWGRAAGIERDAWLANLDLANADPDAPPQPDFADALAAYERVAARIAPRLEALDADALSAADERGRTLASYLARTAAHTWAHAGELVAIGSLAGMADPGLPGPLRHTLGSEPPPA